MKSPGANTLLDLKSLHWGWSQELGGAATPLQGSCEQGGAQHFRSNRWTLCSPGLLTLGRHSAGSRAAAHDLGGNVKDGPTSSSSPPHTYKEVGCSTLLLGMAQASLQAAQKALGQLINMVGSAPRWKLALIELHNAWKALELTLCWS